MEMSDAVAELLHRSHRAAEDVDSGGAAESPRVRLQRAIAAGDFVEVGDMVANNPGLVDRAAMMLAIDRGDRYVILPLFFALKNVEPLRWPPHHSSEAFHEYMKKRGKLEAAVTDGDVEAAREMLDANPGLADKVTMLFAVNRGAPEIIRAVFCAMYPDFK